ncbi:MAG: acyltransferase [Candidatus Aenigmarchaeota archaeon]|nr:acyltransferase [Candidatus Aenigmarchaeota archaeon]
MDEKNKKRMIRVFGYTREERSLSRWKEIRSRKIILRNYLIMMISKILPDTELKNRLYRKTGMKIGSNVSIFGSNFDIFFPELIEIGDNTVIGNKTSVITHEFLSDEWRVGRVKIGSGVTIGTMTVVMPGVEIGDGATVAAYSLVNRDVKKGSLVGGVPIKKLR